MKSNDNNLKNRFIQWFKKRIIHLRRNTHLVPLFGIIIACLVYTLALATHSQAINYMPYNIDAFFAFLITLFAILNIFTFMNYYQKKNYFLYCLVIIMTIVQVILDVKYINTIFTFYRQYPDRPQKFINDSFYLTIGHIISLIVSLILVALYPLYLKRKNKNKYETKRKPAN